MTAISEQVKELREYADDISSVFKEDSDVLKGTFKEAADTIESLSAKLQAANMERSDQRLDNGWIYCDDGKNLPEEEMPKVAPAPDICRIRWKDDLMNRFTKVV